MTQRVVPDPPQRPKTLRTRPPHDTTRCARPRDTRRWQAAPLLRRRILAMDPEATWTRRCPSRRHTTRCAHAPAWHNALRTRCQNCPHDTTRCARPCDTRRWQAAPLLRRRILAMDPLRPLGWGVAPPAATHTTRCAHAPRVTQCVAHTVPKKQPGPSPPPHPRMLSKLSKKQLQL